jgi:hypothetical protein
MWIQEERVKLKIFHMNTPMKRPTWHNIKVADTLRHKHAYAIRLQTAQLRTSKHRPVRGDHNLAETCSSFRISQYEKASIAVALYAWLRQEHRPSWLRILVFFLSPSIQMKWKYLN